MYKNVFRFLSSNSPSNSIGQVNIKNLLNKPVFGNVINVEGWVKSIRKQKQNTFIDLTDGSTHDKIQVVVSSDLRRQELSAGSSICVTGPLTMSPTGQIEIVANKIRLYGVCDTSQGFPFAPRKEYTPEYTRQYLHLRGKTTKFSSLLRVRSGVTLAIHDFFEKEGFINIHAPILTSNDCEGAGETFKVIPDNEFLLKSMTKHESGMDEAFFDTKCFLTVSGQLHLEALANGLSRVYSFGPIFRAENSKSRLHLAEFYMLEAELAFIKELEELLVIVEKLVKHLTSTILNKFSNDIQICQGLKNDKLPWLEKDFKILQYDAAVNILENNSHRFKQPLKHCEGLGKEHELFLVEYCGNVPLFITQWPKKLKPFYMRTCKDDDSKVAAFDLLLPQVGEVVGGSLREERLEALQANLPRGSNLDWYLDLRRYGAVPTGGFGLGFERYLQAILGIENIKDTIPFPRWPHNCVM